MSADTDTDFGGEPMVDTGRLVPSSPYRNLRLGDLPMFKKTLIGTAIAALLGIGMANAATVIQHSPTVDADGIKEKKVILHDNGNRTVVKKKTKYNAQGQKVVKKKVVRHTAGTPSKVTVVHRAPARPVVVQKVVRPAPARTTTVIRETTG